MKKSRKNTMRSWRKPFSKGLWSKIPEVLRKQFWELPLEDRVQLAPQFAAVAISLGLTDDGEAALALVSEDRGLVVEQTAKLAGNIAMRKLKVARLCDRIRELRLHRQIHGCGSQSAYLRNIDARLGMSRASFSFLASAGRGDRLYGDELRKGVEGEAGVDESVIARSLAKLAIYDRVQKARGSKEALRGFKVYSYQKFRRLEFTENPEITYTVKDYLAEQAALQSDNHVAAPAKRRGIPSLDEVGSRSAFELDIRRIFGRGGHVHILSSAMPEALADIDARLDGWRRHIDEENRLHFREGATPLTEEDILASDVALDIEDYIRSIHVGIAANRRTLAILVARLRDEPFFYPRWHEKHNSFTAYAWQVLGIGEELRDLIRIGRNLIRFPSILEGQNGFGTDTHFFSLRYLDQAMANHHSDIALIRARLRSLTTREFAEFARDPYYDKRGSLRRLSAKKEARVVELLCDVNSLIEQGRAVKIIEVLAGAERGQLALMLATAERTLEAKALAAAASTVGVEAPLANSESVLTLAPALTETTVHSDTGEESTNKAA
jgi:hypothetical protein